MFAVAEALVALSVSVTVAHSGAPDPRATPACVNVWTEARYVNYAYDHFVHLQNVCPEDHTCTVSTDVNPKPADVVVHAREHVEVLTYRGSPARTFIATVTCN